MNIVVKITLIVLYSLICMPLMCHAFNLDETVDDDIRKNYNDSKLINDIKKHEEDLPALPNITRYPASAKQPDVKGVNTKPAVIKYKPYSGGNVKITKGTVFDVVNNSNISDYQSRGTRVKFTVKTPVHAKKYAIPAGTAFIGEIADSHQPQITCNGGLIVVRIYSMIYKGQNIPVEAYITKANGKHIFLNNIKGERKYLKTVWKNGGWGRALFNRMLNLTVNLGGDGSTIVLAPFPFLYGTLCVGLNTLVSPVTAFFKKGGHIAIPAGSNFRIKLSEDIYVD